MELEEFEAFLEPDFAPVPFAAALLQATNVADGSELDVHTALKKLKFDAAECDKRIESLTGANHEKLLGNLYEGQSVHDRIEGLVPANKRVQSTYRRLEEEMVVPYDSAVRLSQAFLRMHHTLELLRGSAFFVYFVQQLETEDVVKTARVLRQLLLFYGGEDEEKSVFSVSLKSLRLVLDYRPHLDQKVALLSSQLAARISHDLGHHTSFQRSNEALQQNLAAYHLLQPHEFAALLENSAIAKSIQISLTSLTRALQLPRVLASTINDVAQALETFVRTLGAVLAVSSETAEKRPLLDVLEQSLGAPLAALFYERLALKFKKSLAVTMARGGPIARNLRAQHPALVEALQSPALAELGPYFEDAILVIAK